MKKVQMLYIGLGLLVVFVFMLVTMNTGSPKSFSGYSFDGSLANSAASARGSGRSSRRLQEGFGTAFNSDSASWRLEDYLDDPRGAECANKSFGITASGGPICLSEQQARAMASRGFNTDESGCLKSYYQ